MDITTEFRSHWVAADGTRHETRRSRDAQGQWRKRDDLQPILNMDELLAYADLGDQILPQSGITSQWFARQLIAHPRAYQPWQIAQMCEELTDDIPHYHELWRAPFVALRNRWPGVDGKPVVAYVDTLEPSS